MTQKPSTTIPGVLGLDFGTSNSAMAFSAGAASQALALEGTATTLPTAIFFNAEDRSTHIGRDAIAQYLSGTEGRLMRSLKSLLGSPLLQEQTLVNGRQLSFQDIITGFLSELRERALQQLPAQSRVDRVVLGRPVHFDDDDPVRDALAQRTLEQCARAAGFENLSFELEPIAAALDYERRLTRETRVLVVDIGGGTSDFSVLRLGPQRAGAASRHDDILATSGIHLGGTDFDQRLNLAQVMPLLGLRHIGPSGREVPSAVFHDLATWHLIQWRYSARALREAQALRSDYSELALHDRLMRVLQQRLGHRIANEIELAKIACSDSGGEAFVQLSDIAAGLAVNLTPQAMEAQLQDALARIVACAQECARRAGVAGQGLDALYLTGGSSALAPFRSALQQAFGPVPLVSGDRFGGVAAGLCYASA